MESLERRILSCLGRSSHKITQLLLALRPLCTAQVHLELVIIWSARQHSLHSKWLHWRQHGGSQGPSARGRGVASRLCNFCVIHHSSGFEDLLPSRLWLTTCRFVCTNSSTLPTAKRRCMKLFDSQFYFILLVSLCGTFDGQNSCMLPDGIKAITSPLHCNGFH